MKTCPCCGQIVPDPASADAGDKPSFGGALAHVRDHAPVEAVEADAHFATFICADGMSADVLAADATTPDATIAAPGRFTVRVDDIVAGLCNEAHADAERRGARAVEIAHLVLRFAMSSASRSIFEQAAVSRLALFDSAKARIEADAALGGAANRGRVGAGNGSPQTSADLKILLVRAEEAAAGDDRSYAGAQDLLLVLMTRTGDLTTGEFLRGVRGYTEYRPPIKAGAVKATIRQDGSTTRQVQLEMELRRPPSAEIEHNDSSARSAQSHGGRQGAPPQGPKFDERPTSDQGAAAQRNSERRISHSADRDHRRGQLPVKHGRVAFEQERQWPAGSAAELLDRLHRQEAQLAELRAFMAGMIARRDSHADVQGAGGQGPGAGGLRWVKVRASTGDKLKTEASVRADLSSHGGRAAARGGGRERSAGAGSASSGTGGNWGEGIARFGAPQTGRDLRDPGDVDDLPVTAADNDTDEESGTGERMKRFYLSPDDDIVKAPSIGPRTAARLIPMGLVLVRDLLNCDPEVIAAKVGARYMPAARIAEWRAQSRLVCTIPWLRGTHAQLLVGAGFDTLAKLVRADASAVCAAVLRFAGTREGQSILRSGPAPEIDRIACWIENTAMAEPARAA